MKKFITAFLAGTVFALPFFSQSKNFSFELEPFFGIRNGVLNEYVYSKNSKTGEEYYLSLLNWNITNSLYSGFSADFGFRDFHVSGDLKALLPNDFGSMNDSDWLQDVGYKTGNSNVKTNYSVHDMSLIEGFNIGVKAFYDFHPVKSLTIAPSVGFSYETYSMMGKNGTYYYGKSNGSIPGGNTKYSYFSYDDAAHRTTGPFNGNVIKLEREDYYTWIGFNVLYTTPDSHWDFGLSADVSPWTYLVSRDTHFLNNGTTGTYYLDVGGQAFSAFRGTIFAQFNLNNLMALKLSGNGLCTTEIKGIEYTSSTVDGPYKKNGAVIGSASRYLDFQVSAKMKF